MVTYVVLANFTDPPPAAMHPISRHSNPVFDADYVEGLAKYGIARPPGYEPPPAVPIIAK